MASEAESNWLDDYLDHGDAKLAVRKWFPENKHPIQRASQLKIKFADDIERRVRQGFAVNAPQAASVIIDLASNADQPAVKLKACQDILSRGGFNPVAESRELTEQPNEAELKERLQMALRGIDPKTLADILGAGTLQTIAKQIATEPELPDKTAELLRNRPAIDETLVQDDSTGPARH